MATSPTTTPALALLRDKLVELQFHPPLHAAHLGADRGTPQQRLAWALEHTGDGSALSCVLRLFLIGVEVPADSARAALGVELVEGLIARGLLVRRGANVKSEFAIAFSGEAAVAQDFTAHTAADERDDFVTPVGGATRILGALTVPTPGGRVLEIGTGQGLPAVFASQWAKAAVGTDISERSLRCAAMTAELNRRGNVEFRKGSLFEPVASTGEQFDAIISNPPFVLSPRAAMESLVGGRAGASGENDGGTFTERVVRGCGPFLAERGFATVLGNWPHATEQDWAEPIRAWTHGNGCDVLALQIKCETPHAYASAWRREIRMLQPFREPAPMQDWIDMFAALGAGAVSFGVIVLRKRAGANWFHTMSRSTAGMQPEAGKQLRRWFDGRTRLLEAGSMAKLLAQSPRLSEALLLTGRPGALGKGAAGLNSGVLQQTQGWPEAMPVDPIPLAVLCACDGRATLKQAIGSVAAAHRMNPESLERSLAPVLTRWLESGFLS